MVQRPCDRVKRSSGCHEGVIEWFLRLLFSSLFSACLVECRMKKALKLVIEYAVEWCDGDTRPLGRVRRSSGCLMMEVKTLDLGVE